MSAGVPFTSGFLAKFYVIGSAVDARSFWLALVAMLSSVISAYAYLKVVLAMYGEEPEEGAATYKVPAGARIALVLAVTATIGFGLAPAPLTDAARTAAFSTRQTTPTATSSPPILNTTAWRITC